MSGYYFLIVNLMFSILAYFLTLQLIPHFIDMFLKAKVFGIDVNKKNKPKIPESFGVVIGCVYLVTLFLFLPIPFTPYILNGSDFPHYEFVEMVAALLSICCMLLLGFADDVLDLRWRHKLFLPTVASLPLLVVYYVNFNSTTIIVPKPLRHMLGLSLDMGVFYYLYMGMLAVFCTNAINILAGVNGLETGQSVIIAASVAIFNVIELFGVAGKSHVLSLYFVLPFVAVSLPLLQYNWFPAKVFVGDTYCYFAGMTFAVVGILGHFSKTVLLFFIPQVFNFLYSLPQLFHLIPCPRHRLPRLNDKGKLEASCTEFSLDGIPLLGRMCFNIFRKLHLIKVYEEKGRVIKCNNFTIINMLLIAFGPTKENVLASRLMLVQVIGSCIAFTIRYPLASFFF